MTREEAIYELKRDIHNAKVTHHLSEHYEMAIEALEQEPILDKIRSEMFKERLSHSGTGEEVIQAYADGLKKGIEIIDKYKGESED